MKVSLHQAGRGAYLLLIGYGAVLMGQGKSDAGRAVEASGVALLATVEGWAPKPRRPPKRRSGGPQ